MRHALRMPRAFGPGTVAVLALLLSSGGAPEAPSGLGPDAMPAARPSVRTPAGVVPLGQLGPGPVERPMRTGEGHGWLLRLEAGDFAHVRIDQLGVDVTLAVFDPAGRLLLEIDTPTPMGFDGEEHLYLEAPAGGMHRLEARAVDDHGDTPRYRARLEERRPATEADRARVAAEALFHRATAERVAGRHDVALALLTEAESAFERLGDDHRLAKVRYGRCTHYYNHDDYRRAAPDCAAALAYYRRHGPSTELASALSLLGRSQLNLDDPWSALGSFEESLALRRQLADEWAMASVHTDLGMAHRQLSDFPRALAELGRALEIWERLGERDRAVLVLHERGLLYRKLGEAEAATRDFRRALERMSPDDPQRPLTLIALGLALVEQGDGTTALQPLQEALGPLAEALEIEERRGSAGDTARVLAAMGLVHQQTGDPEEATRRYDRALPLAREAGDRELVGDLYFNLGGLAGDGAAGEARPLLERALIEYRRAGNREAQITTLLALARDERTQGRPHAGLQHLETARILFAELRERLPRPDLRVSFMAHRYDLFDSAIDLLMDLHRQSPDQGWDVRAFEMSEQARGRGLLDLIAGRRTAPAAPAGEALTLAAIQHRLLDPGTVLFEYKLGDEQSYLWAVEHDRLAAFELPPREHLESLAASFHDQLAQPPRHAAAAALERTGAELSRALLCPARDRLSGRRLIVIAEGELLYMPFAALGLGACDGPGALSPKPLSAEHPILAGASASALAALRRRPRAAPERTLAVVADPVFDRCDPRLEARYRGDGCEGGYPRLEHSGTEAESILGRVPPGERAAALGFEARRDRVDGLASGARYLHFATHAETAADPPRLLLSRVDPRGRPLEAADLTADEIARMSLAADLVVLGGCDTGGGRQFRGEGLVGLAHAFFEAGAGGVLATLWPIDDRATAVFMEHFYRRLLDERLPPAAALAGAQLEMLSTSRWRAPYYWAGFVLLGEGLPAVEPDPDPAGLLVSLE